MHTHTQTHNKKSWLVNIQNANPLETPLSFSHPLSISLSLFGWLATCFDKKKKKEEKKKNTSQLYQVNPLVLQVK